MTEADPAAVEALLDAAFGADRRGRTAYRLREGATAIPTLSFAAWQDARLVGTLQSWPVALQTGADTDKLVMVGPVAVVPDVQGAGVGKALMDRLIAAADAQRAGALVMIGDPEYYERWGFTADGASGWRIDGPYEQRRLLARLRRKTAASGELVALGPSRAGGNLAEIAAL
ncbi:N-acetyltransferase [Sphingomonas sp. ID1715]|nr:N-acetyltransferase [Sphingomonas sp. ID1715]